MIPPYLYWILPILAVSFLTIILIYVINHLLLYFKATRTRKILTSKCENPTDWPFVSIHLPFHNEKKVAARIIESCLHFDYPKGKFEIIIIDDSNDGTTDIAKWFQKQYSSVVKVFHRQERQGFKAGALNVALKHSKGEFIAIFDADYVPPQYFLKKVIPYLLSDEKVAFVQTRCSHLNRRYNWVTKAAALAIDWFWKREQQARYETGVFTHFGGTGAVFKKQVINEAGGWSEDTLVEDLDLSIKLQLNNWQYIYLHHISCKGEIPPSLYILSKQQFRWAKGFTQCLVKYYKDILKSKMLSLNQKIETILQLAIYSTAPALLGLIVLLQVSFLHLPLELITMVGLSILGGISIPIGINIAISLTDKNYLKDFTLPKFDTLKALSYLIIITPLIVLVYCKAVIEAILGFKSSFIRTRKYGLYGQEQKISSDYLKHKLFCSKNVSSKD
jgi:cellulose synthase/poly-beta-1,6-N-acetylglucosamine synthase-like glycosyltransferase